MACSLTITGVSGVTSGGVLTSIVVTGEALKCGSVTVTIFCDQQQASLVGVPVDTSTVPGTWTATFTDVPASCLCQGKIDVIVRCDDNIESCATKTTLQLPCAPKDGVCPSLLAFNTSTGDCNPDGTRTVTVSATLSSPGAYAAELRDSSATPLASVVGTGVLVLTGSGNYAGPETFTVVVTAPLGCLLPSFGVTVPPCAQCPSIDFDYEIGGCDRAGNRTVTVTAQLSGPGPYTAELRSAANALLDTVSGGGILVLSHTATLPGGTSAGFKVLITSPTTCGTAEIEIDVPPCACPEVEFNAVVGKSCDAQGRRTVTVTATLSSPTAYTAELRNEANAVLDTVSGSGTQTLTHTGQVAGGTSPTFTVVITDPSLCGESQHQVSVPSCGTRPSDEDDEGLGCGGLRLLVAIAAALAILAALLAICVPPASTALWIAAGIAAAAALIGGLLYSIFCPHKPCGVTLLISGQALLGAGVAAVVLSACCPWMIWAGLLLIGLGLGALLLWKQRCDKSTCALAKEITLVIGGVVLPVLSILVLIPVLVACVSLSALAWVSGVFGVIASYAAKC